jgi:hypothetical protein
MLLGSLGYPNGIINQLQAAQTSSSPRLDLESENRYLNFEKLIALNDIVRIKLDSNEIDSAIYYLQTDGSIESTCLLVPVSIKRDTSITRQALATIHAEGFDPDVIARDTGRAEDMQNVCAFGNFILKIATRSGGYYSMTPNEKLTLEDFANQELSVSTYARSILRWLEDEVQFDDAYPYDIDRKMKPETNISTSASSNQTDVLIYPNPSEGVFIIEGVTTLTFANGAIEVTDILGRKIQTVPVTVQRFNVVLDLSNEPSGIYFVRLLLDSKVAARSKLVKQ